jgi:hypothetical protein
MAWMRKMGEFWVSFAKGIKAAAAINAQPRM